MKFFIGILVIIVGALMVIKTEGFIAVFGKSSWAEQHLGTSGGTRFLYKIIGIILIIGTGLSIAGVLDDMILGVVGPLFGA